MKFKKLLSFAAACAMAVTSLTGAISASADESDYSLSGTNQLISYIGSETDVTLPTMVDGIEVTSTYQTFRNNTNIKSVVVPEGYTEIGSSTFEGCTSLEKVTLPSTLTTLGSNSFKSCIALGSTGEPIVIPSSVTTISSSAFNGCTDPNLVIYIRSTNTTAGLNAFKGVVGTIYVYTPEVYEAVLKRATTANVVLVADIDYSELNEALSNAGKYQETSCTADSYKVLSDAVAAGNTVLANTEATQEDINNAAVAINNAIANLKPDYTVLNEAITAGEAIDTSIYTEATVTTLTNAITAGKAVLANTEATATDISNAVTAINDAIAGLVDLTALKTAIANGEAIDTSIYTEATVTTLTNAIAAGKTVLANTEATATDVNNAVKAINDAIAGLKKTPPDSEHITAFNNALNKYRNIFDTNYTEESYAQYKVVLDKMLEMYNNGRENYTNEEIDAIISEIEDAYNKLELKLVFDYTELETAVANAKKITDDETSADKYMPKSYQYLLTKLEKGEALLADKNAETHTQSDINATTYEINYAIDHLEAANKAELFSTLQDTITKAEALDKDKYTAESFAPLTEALETAKAVSAESSLADIVSAQEALDSASEGLVFNQTTVPAGEPFGYIRHGWTSTPFLKGVIDESMAGATQIKFTFDCADDTSYNSYFETPIEANIGGTVTNFAMKASTTAENLGEKDCTATMTLTAPVEAGQSYTLTGYTYGYASAKDYIFAIKKIEFMDSTGYILGTVTDKTIAQDDLAEAITKAEALDTANYTDESVAVLTAAIEAAKALTDEATVEEINAAATAIEDAVKGLVEKPAPTEPDPTKPAPSQPDPTNPEPSKPTTKAPAKTTAVSKTTRSAAVVAKDKAAAEKVMKQAKIKKLTVKSKAKKKINVTWKKVKKAVGYEVQVSTNKKFKKSKIIIKKLTSKKKLTIKNKKIKSGKKYFVRVRAYATYKNANGTSIKVYSNWNKKLRTVKVK